MPAGETSGTLAVDGTTIDIDPARSLTWYDRQWQDGAASNWTWFALHTHSPHGGPGRKLSIWFYPSGEGHTKGFATQELSGVQTVMPATLTISEKAWTSQTTNYTYAQDWNITLADDICLQIRSIRDDQELTDSNGLFVTYEGYVEVSGDQKGYGLVEIQPS